MRSVIYLILGVICGVAGCVLFQSFSKKDHRYFELQRDYTIEGQGFLKQGTLLQYDKSYPEGFTRYVLYLNLKDSGVKEYKPQYKDEIIPYWLDRK